MSIFNTVMAESIVYLHASLSDVVLLFDFLEYCTFDFIAFCLQIFLKFVDTEQFQR